jgi:hypothetical protein
MEGVASKETHFRLLQLYRVLQNHLLILDRVVITSDAFQSKSQPARHRMVYALLKDEMAREGGIHALQLRTRTLDEEKRQLAQGGESPEEKVAEKSRSQ